MVAVREAARARKMVCAGAIVQSAPEGVIVYWTVAPGNTRGHQDGPHRAEDGPPRTLTHIMARQDNRKVI